MFKVIVKVRRLLHAITSVCPSQLTFFSVAIPKGWILSVLFSTTCYKFPLYKYCTGLFILNNRAATFQYLDVLSLLWGTEPASEIIGLESRVPWALMIQLIQLLQFDDLAMYNNSNWLMPLKYLFIDAYKAAHSPRGYNWHLSIVGFFNISPHGVVPTAYLLKIITFFLVEFKPSDTYFLQAETGYTTIAPTLPLQLTFILPSHRLTQPIFNKSINTSSRISHKIKLTLQTFNGNGPN